MASASFTQAHFWARNDDGSETAATWKTGNPDTDWNQNPADSFRIRFQIWETAGRSGALTLILQYNKSGAGWNNVAAGQVIAPYDSANLTDGANASWLLPYGSSFTSSNKGIADLDGTAIDGSTIGANNVVEAEYSVNLTAALVADGDTIQLRCVNSGGVLLAAYTHIPTLTVSSGPKDVHLACAATVTAIGSASLTVPNLLSYGTVSVTSAGNLKVEPKLATAATVQVTSAAALRSPSLWSVAAISVASTASLSPLLPTRATVTVTSAAALRPESLLSVSAVAAVAAAVLRQDFPAAPGGARTVAMLRLSGAGDGLSDMIAAPMQYQITLTHDRITIRADIALANLLAVQTRAHGILEIRRGYESAGALILLPLAAAPLSDYGYTDAPGGGRLTLLAEQPVTGWGASRQRDLEGLRYLADYGGHLSIRSRMDTDLHPGDTVSVNAEIITVGRVLLSEAGTLAYMELEESA